MKDIFTLKKYILESEDISQAVSYFFDLIEQDQKDHSLKQHRVENVSDDPELSIAIHAAIVSVSKALKKQCEVVDQMFIKVDQAKFYHGYCILSDPSTSLLVLYCSDYQLGIAVLGGPHGKVDYLRFSLTLMTKNSTIN
jgi:hypothetical protein